MKKFKRLGLLAGLSLTLIAAGCGSDEDAATENEAEGTEGEDVVEEADGVSIAEELDFTITGIDPSAGVMEATERAIEEYELEGFNVQPSSDAAMTAALGTAIENEEAIVVPGWTPHWKFSKYDLKFLEDPKGVFGEAENIHTIVRLGLEEDLPEAYQVLDNFYWTPEDMGEIMIAVNEGQDPDEAAAEWIENNEDKVAEWTDGVGTVDGESITLALVAWDSEIASTHMIANVLEDIGYDVEISPLQANGMFQAVAGGSADAIVAAWLPLTHQHFMDDHEGEFVDLGVNLEGAQTGLVVPAYVEIDSIEELVN
ncbi:glycine betaine ABC transporter substrate-binding protein [Desertibacillus haloalkaliphilus]|uniref:glycine betaine ABC transporter substrate-binding protein n=1 Tax=Desertibacillus haloalkaliphilus TaxID=1328930 RepID=UPI001C26A747|nr:glycine betaine ABC transporter substrate-binding protein [Desertibacillus haloalkaliphilus]MBU8907461.1 glycine/betaine ABC transporter [Desertibacillus haloalkaliphilus]